MLRLLLLITFAVMQIPFAFASDDFNRAAAQAAEKSKAGAGVQYPLKVTFSVSNQVVHSMQDCGNEFPLGSSFDLVLIISADGHIERVLYGPLSPYGKCIISHLRLPQTVARPPSGSWPVQIRLLHGGISPEQKNSAIPIITDNADAIGAAKGASAAYAAKVMHIGQQHFIPALQKDVKRWGSGTIRVLYQVDRSGHMHDLRIFCKPPNPWAEETIRRTLSGIKFPPIPNNVLKEVHSDHIDVEDAITNRNQ